MATRMIFCLTTGRSGTGYLYQLLRLFPNISAQHEPVPLFSDVMRSAQTQPIVAHNFWKKVKLPAICQQRRTYPIYAETSHLFGKGFVKPLLNLGIVPDIIVLRRNCRDVAKSFFALRTIPGRTEHGLTFLLSPGDPTVMLPLPDWKHFNDYQLCYWYCLEMEKRIRAYKPMIKARKGIVVETTLRELKTFAGFEKVRSALRLQPLAQTAIATFIRLQKTRVNHKDGRKFNVIEATDPLDAWENEVRTAVHWKGLVP